MFGVGVVFERTCTTDCKTCTGSAFDRSCRLFAFRPHYDVQLLRKSEAMTAQVRVVFSFVLRPVKNWDRRRRIRTENSDRISCICLFR